jgi:DNA polymerase sigma
LTVWQTRFPEALGEWFGSQISLLAKPASDAALSLIKSGFQ